MLTVSYVIICFYLITIYWFIRKNKKLKKKNSNKNIIATITHDLKNPAIAQIRALELLLKGNFGEINDSQKSFIKDILNSCNTMLDMLLNMLWLYKFDNNKVSVNKTNFCVNDLIEEIFKENKLMFSYKNQKFEFNSTAKIFISADRMHIKRIIFNLIVNAINYSKNDSVINIDISISNNKFILIIRNNGKYIPEEKLKCIKDRNNVFNQKSEGLSTGLGLYLTNSLLELNGGNFICNSSKDGVNRFGFTMDLSKKNKNFIKKLTEQLIGK
ncbi:HAMP domain-containing histidine kinase [bacterium]|nr:HAMP domain-containing histidine kinase [bacterium]